MNGWKKFVNPKTFYIFSKTFLSSIIFSKYGDNNDRILKKKKVLKFLYINRYGR